MKWSKFRCSEFHKIMSPPFDPATTTPGFVGCHSSAVTRRSKGLAVLNRLRSSSSRINGLNTLCKERLCSLLVIKKHTKGYKECFLIRQNRTGCKVSGKSSFSKLGTTQKQTDHLSVTRWILTEGKGHEAYCLWTFFQNTSSKFCLQPVNAQLVCDCNWLKGLSTLSFTDLCFLLPILASASSTTISVANYIISNYGIVTLS